MKNIYEAINTLKELNLNNDKGIIAVGTVLETLEDKDDTIQSFRKQVIELIRNCQMLELKKAMWKAYYKGWKAVGDIINEQIAVNEECLREDKMDNYKDLHMMMEENKIPHDKWIELEERKYD